MPLCPTRIVHHFQRGLPFGRAPQGHHHRRRRLHRACNRQYFPWPRFGVTVVYRGKEILSRFDQEVRQVFTRAMTHKAFAFLTEAMLEGVRRGDDGRLHVIRFHGEAIDADQVMLAVGRLPNTEKLGLERAGVAPTSSAQSSSTQFSEQRPPTYMLWGDVTNRVQHHCRSPSMRPCVSFEILHSGTIRPNRTMT